MDVPEMFIVEKTMVGHMQNLKLRRYRECDLDNIEKLLRSHFEASVVPKRKLIFDWIASHNPAASNEKCYLVIENANEIIAYEGRMPVDLMINGKKERGYFFHDTLVHPEYRKKGLGLALVNDLKSTWENATDTFAVGVWMNQFTHEILRRRGYYELSANYFIKPINLESRLTKIVGNIFVARLIATFVRALNGVHELVISNHRDIDITLSQIVRFDQRFDDFAEKISSKFNLIVLRHSRYLNWKYVDKPFANYTILTAERNKDLAGYVILLPTKIGDISVGVIVDILADPDDSQTIASLCQAAINYFKKVNVDFIVCLLTNKNFIRIFKRYLFLKRRKIAPVMIANLHKHHAQEEIKDISNWFFTCGDSDGFVWQ